MNVEYKLDYEKINKALGKNYQFFRRKKTYVLPLPTREPDRAKFERGFISVVGGVIRKISKLPINIEANDNFREKLPEIVGFPNEESEDLFNYFIQVQLEELTEGDIDSLQQLEQVPLVDDKNELKGEIDYIHFFYDTFIRDDEEYVKKIINRIDSPHIINDILSYVAVIEEVTEKQAQQSAQLYRNHFPDLKEQFLKDLESLSKNEAFFFENIDTLFVHYTTVAISQTVLQTNHLADFHFNNFIPIYYILHWEKAAKWRQSYKEGFKLLREQISEFYAHEHALNILGFNTFTTEDNLFYHDLKQILQKAGPKAEKEFTQSIYTFLETIYQTRKGIEVEEYEEHKTLDDAFKDILNALKKGVSTEIKSRYPKAFEALLSKFFRKHGGSLGNLLSLTREQLLLLIAVSVGDERMELNQLWTELEKRGIWFDYLSKEEVVLVLDKLNYMEKKSDSGDAQYVKSIL